MLLISLIYKELLQTNKKMPFKKTQKNGKKTMSLPKKIHKWIINIKKCSIYLQSNENENHKITFFNCQISKDEEV